MNAVLMVWLLVAAGSSHTSLTVIGRFNNKAACEQTAVEIEAQTASKRNMNFFYGVCVPARADSLLRTEP